MIGEDCDYYESYTGSRPTCKLFSTAVQERDGGPKITGPEIVDQRMKAKQNNYLVLDGSYICSPLSKQIRDDFKFHEKMDVDECKDMCLANDDCLSFDFASSKC